MSQKVYAFTYIDDIVNSFVHGVPRRVHFALMQNDGEIFFKETQENNLQNMRNFVQLIFCL